MEKRRRNGTEPMTHPSVKIIFGKFNYNLFCSFGMTERQIPPHFCNSCY